MTSLGNISTLITIICGLMLTDLFASMHRLIRHRNRVRWHWLPLMAAWYVLIVILKNWWSLVFFQNEQTAANGWYFFYYAHLLFLFYLVVSAVLPDDIPAEGIDLRQFYIENRHHFWGLFSGVSVLILLATLFRSVFTDAAFNWVVVGVNALAVGINLSLAWVRNLYYHKTLLLLLVALALLEVYSGLI